MNQAVRIAVIDSGVHAKHPHVNGVAGGVAITPDGREENDFVDRLGHGTAVTAVIREKAPDAAIFAVKIFHDSLATRIQPLLRAIDWSVENRMHVINLSLGTSNQEHEPALLAARRASGRSAGHARLGLPARPVSNFDARRWPHSLSRFRLSPTHPQPCPRTQPQRHQLCGGKCDRIARTRAFRRHNEIGTCALLSH